MNRQEVHEQALRFLKIGRLAEAGLLYDDLLAADPTDFDALHRFGILKFRQGMHDEALQLVQRALKIRMDARALSTLGSILKTQGRYEEALASFDAALEANPVFPDAIYNRASTFGDMQRYDLALKDYNALVSLMPEDADALLGRGTIHINLKQYDNALADYNEAIFLRPHSFEALNARGVALRYLKRYEEARESFDRALKIKPDYLDALYNRGYMEFYDCGHYGPAVRDFEAAYKFDAEYNYVLGDLLHLRMYGADWRDFENLLSRINTGIREAKHVVTPFVYQAISESPADLKSCSIIYSTHRYPAQSRHAFKSIVNPKIRLGYVSGEFRAHATAHLTVGLYEQHDRDKFEIVAFDNGWDDGTPLRKRIECAFDQMIEISSLSDQAAAELIRSENINILIDLNGYFGLGRPGIFAQKPAPIQVNYLGFPATLGTPVMDYIIADRWVIPESEMQFYTEKVVYLPDTYQANDFLRPIAHVVPTRAECGLPERAFVFCNFNSSYKITPVTFALWMQILNRTKNSVLWLLGGNATYVENIRREASRAGVSPDRIIFAAPIPADRHLARLKNADLFLDSLPYNAHTTASDALWAGLPIITCYGKSFAGRVSSSLLHAVGLSELVVNDSREYVAFASRLAAEPALRESIRKKLCDNRLTAPLFDTDRYRKNLEVAYVIMQEKFQLGLSAESFVVGSSVSV